MRSRICSSLHPSIRAASVMSLGNARKNCRSKKTLNAPARNEGTQSGLKVPIQPNDLNNP